MDWSFEGKPFVEVPDLYGFIYEIEYTDGSKYIGKKNFYDRKELDPLKKGGTRKFHIEFVGRNRGGKRVKREVFKTVSNWMKYEGSHDTAEDLTIASKTIIALVPTKRSLTYLEAKMLFCKEAIEDDTYLNIQILGRFFKDNLL